MTRAAAILVHTEMRLTTGKLFARLKEMIGALLCLLRSQRSTLLPPASNRLFLATIHCALIFALFSAPAFSQTGTATINGQITDPQGRIVPNVSVQAVNTATNVVYPGKTNSSGIYSIGSLPPGSAPSRSCNTARADVRAHPRIPRRRSIHCPSVFEGTALHTYLSQLSAGRITDHSGRAASSHPQEMHARSLPSKPHRSSNGPSNRSLGRGIRA